MPAKFPEGFVHEPLQAYSVGTGGCAPVFNVNIIPNEEIFQAYLESAKLAVVRAILEDQGVDGLLGFSYSVSMQYDDLYGVRIVIVNSYVNAKRYCIALRYPLTR